MEHEDGHAQQPQFACRLAQGIHIFLAAIADIDDRIDLSAPGLVDRVLQKLADLCLAGQAIDAGHQTGQFARVKLQFEPLEAGSGFVFESTIVGGSVPKEYIPGVEKGLEMAKENGLLAGYPVTDFKATLVDGAFHDVDSSVLAFEIASRGAFRELKGQGDPRLMEPIMNVEVVTPEDYMGDVIGDLNSRRGQIQGSEPRGNAVAIKAFVPLVNMFGYVSDLRGMSQGRAQFTMIFAHYDEVPRAEAQKIISEVSGS